MDVVSKFILNSSIDRKFWIALNKGLVSCELVNDQLNCEKVSEAFIHYLLEDPVNPEKYIWCATKNRGLQKIDKISGKAITISKKQGLPDNEVYAIAFDSLTNSFWVSSNQGISKIEYETHKISNFTIDDGFLGPEFNSGAVITDSFGNLYFGSVNGFSKFYPSKIVKSEYKPNTSITQLEINGFNKDNLLYEKKR